MTRSLLEHTRYSPAQSLTMYQHQVYLTPASLQRMNSAHQERWMDVQGRATMAAMLILGKLPGGNKLLAGNTNVVGEQPKFGVDVDNAAKTILGEA